MPIATSLISFGARLNILFSKDSEVLLNDYRSNLE